MDIGDLNRKYDQAKTARVVHEPDWMLNRAFFSGLQWVMYAGGRVAKPKIDPRRQLVTDNRITAVVTSRVSRKTKNRPMFAATPQGADDSAIDAARVAERVLENDWVEQRLQSKMFAALLWADICANGFLKIFWDKTLGEKTQYLAGPEGPLMNPQDNTPLKPDEIEMLPPELLANQEFMSQVRTEEVAQGDIAVEVMSVFEMFPDPLATSMDDIEWMIEEKVRSVEYVKRRYPNNLAGEPFEPTPDSDIPSGLSEGWTGGGQVFGDGTANYRGVKVKEYWCKPSSKYPKGWWAVWANDTLLRSEVPFDPMPYVKFDSIRVPGKFWSHSVTTDLRGPQQDLNSIRTQIKENARRLGNPAIMKSRQANVRYEGTPGEIIEYDSTVQDPAPQYLEPPSIPPYVENEIVRIEKSIEEIAGIHEVSRATVPPGVTAASAINLLQEADETRLGPEIQQMEQALGDLGTKILMLRAQYNTDQRIMRIAGEDGNWDIFAFRGEMLGQNPRVDVQAGSAMPRSKAAKQAAMTEVLALMLQYGVPIDERNLRKFLKDYEVGGLDRLFEGFSEDAKQVNRENRQLIEGNVVPINSFDNHEFHIAEHTEFQKTHRYHYLPENIKAMFDLHVAEHRRYMLGIVNKQVEATAQEQLMAREQEAAFSEQEMMTEAELNNNGGNNDGSAA
jgi:hypothetical protein